jgi:hypothetical protein
LQLPKRSGDEEGHRMKTKLTPQVVSGTPIWYQPIIGRGEQRWSGFTDGEPWQLGHGEWVVNLCDMDPNYEYAATKGNRVIAAYFDALRLRKEPTK